MVALSLDDRLLAAYIFYGVILMLKTALMSLLTGRQRNKKQGKWCEVQLGNANAESLVFPYKSSNIVADVVSPQ